MDKVTFAKYQRFPPEKLGAVVARYVAKNQASSHPTVHGYIRRKEDGGCPFFGVDRLCGIQKEYGAQLLTSTCSLYPRSLAEVNDVLEGSLSLSCPEAARLVLLSEAATEVQANLFSGAFRTDNVFAVRRRPGLDDSFLPIRDVIAALICDRSRPVWQRLLLIATLCSRLDDAASGEAEEVERVLGRYAGVLGQGASSELEGFETCIAVRLELAITLSDQRCRSADCGQRFREVFWDFIEGVATSEDDGPGGDVRRFQEAAQGYLGPVLDSMPFLLENYLLNYLYQQLFPFGRTGSARFVERSMLDEAILLIVQFSWMTALLTGVAGRHGPVFSRDHIVKTVQAFTREVEHVPQVHEEALVFARSRELDHLAGLASLLKP